MFDPRWDDDPRDRAEGSRDLSRGSRGGGSDPRERDRADPRDVFVEHVDLPRGHEREHVHHHGHDYSLRGSESRTLSSVGAFRVIPANDLRDTFDKPLDPRHGELWHLREAGLVQTVRIDRDHTVVALTREGRDLLESRRWDREPDAPERDRQAFHDGIQRPRELKHDADLYRAYLEEAERLHEMGAEIHRVVLVAQRVQRVEQNRAGENVPRITHARRPRSAASSPSAPRLHLVHDRGSSAGRQRPGSAPSP